MKRKGICTIAEDIGCPQRGPDGLCNIENTKCSFWQESGINSKSAQGEYTKKEKWFEKYYRH